MDQSIQMVLGLIFIPVSILLFVFAIVWQIYIMLTESYTLDRFKDTKLALVITALFLSFSLAVYVFCPNAWKKGKWFWLAAISGGIMYYLQMKWLPRAK